VPQVGTSTAGSPYTWRGAAAATQYYCQVVAVDKDNNDSPASSQIVVTTPPMPAAPVNVTATAVSSTRVTVTWTENIPAKGLPISNYTIFRGTPTSGLTKLPNMAKTTSFTDNTVVPGGTYYYAIEASDTGHDISLQSAPSAPVTTQ
jgi:fibronectin type 3 domain-containing protein